MSPVNQLKLTPFEWTMSNEFLGSVIEFAVRLCSTGTVDVERFNTAIVNALKQQPLLQANATIGATHSSSYWRPASNLTPVIKWINGIPADGRAATDDFQPIDLKNEIGFRFYGWQFSVDAQPQVEMRFVFQHACCDGKGAIHFIEDVLCQYKLLTEGKCDAMPSFDSDRVLFRDQHILRSYNIADRIWRTLVVRPKRVANMLLTRPLSLNTRSATNSQALAVVPHQCSATLDQATTEKLGVYAQSTGATTNLVLARELFHVLSGHIESYAAKDATSRGSNLLRILVPYSLRNETHQSMPAANCVSMAYLETAQDSLIQDGAENSLLLADLVKQFAFIQKWQLQYSWIEAIRTHGRLWPLIRLFKRRRKKKSGRRGRQVATAVLSNLGRVFSAGCLLNGKGKIKIDSLEIETAHLILPCTVKLSTNFAVNFYGNRLTLDVSYLPSMIARETAQELLDSWQSRIEEVTIQNSQSGT